MSTTTTTIAKSVPFQSVSPIVKRKTMSITQTYFLAHRARAKLSSEAGRPDHNLRLLVGHANLLDSLMLELADAEREQESWFNQSVRVAAQHKAVEAPAPASTPLSAVPESVDRHVQWADTIIEVPEEDWEAEDADDDDESDVSSDASSDFDSDESEDEDVDAATESPTSDDYLDSSDDEDVEMADAAPIQLKRVASHKGLPKIEITALPQQDEAEQLEHEQHAGEATEDDSDVEVDDDEADYAHLSLTRSPSHAVLDALAASAPTSPLLSPPDLVVSEDSDLSEDEAALMPPSPPVPTLDAFGVSSSKKAPSDSLLYLPPRNPARLISAISVY